MSTPTKGLTLFELNSLVKEAIDRSMPDLYWVVAEINELVEHQSGHCYMELCQKDEVRNAIKAKARATIWSSSYRMIKPYFETTAKRHLSRGLKIMIRVQVAFHELYGYSLTVVDIEPSYTIGDIELKRRETIQKLTDDGVVEMNRELQFPDLPKRIAVISAIKAAGLQDFINQLDNNSFGYSFTHTIFPSLMQGDEAENSIINALNSINNQIDDFDVVVIVRGGGSQSDLACFDSYLLALNIAQFPLPVITGIGHDKDQSVADFVANISVKTPTAAAEAIIGLFSDSEELLNNSCYHLSEIVTQTTKSEWARIDKYKYLLGVSVSGNLQRQNFEIERRAKAIPIAVNRHIVASTDFITRTERRYLLSSKSKIAKNQNRLEHKSRSVKSVIEKMFIMQKNKLDRAENVAKMLDPLNMLKKGYSITYFEGKVLTNSCKIKSGDTIVTRLKEGEVRSNVNE